MKICITAQGDNLESPVELRFGRSPYFIIYDTETSKFDVIKNFNIESASGVGIQSGQLMADKEVAVVLTGKVGPKASSTLTAAGIKVIAVTAKTVKEAIEQYQKGDGLIITEEKKEMNNISEKQNMLLPGSWFGRACRRVFGNMRSVGVGGGRGRGIGRGQGR
jgi:predicted Fe-Mo cluster-binding NifX family protein